MKKGNRNRKAIPDFLEQMNEWDTRNEIIQFNFLWAKLCVMLPCLLLLACLNSYAQPRPITLSNDSNRVITGHTGAIALTNCKNIRIVRDTISNVRNGIVLYKCQNIHIDTCEIDTMIASYPGDRNHALQFIQSTGSVTGCTFRNDSRVDDIINVYNCFGTLLNKVYISGNLIIGGGKGAGLQLGDHGGAWQTAFNNVLVNPGSVGISVGGGTSIAVIGNTITGAGLAGIDVENYTPRLPMGGITIITNRVKWVGTAFYSRKNAGVIAGWETRGVQLLKTAN